MILNSRSGPAATWDLLRKVMERSVGADNTDRNIY